VSGVLKVTTQLTDGRTMLDQTLHGIKPGRPINLDDAINSLERFSVTMATLPNRPPLSPDVTLDPSKLNTPFAIKLDCDTQTILNSKLIANRISREAHVARYKAELSQIDPMIGQIDAAYASAAFLAENLEKIIGIPEIGTTFGVDAVVLVTRLQPALTRLQGDLRGLKTRYVKMISDQEQATEADKKRFSELEETICSGKKEFPNGDKYEGGFRHGEPEGLGLLTIKASGDRYQGEFSGGRPTGGIYWIKQPGGSVDSYAVGTFHGSLDNADLEIFVTRYPQGYAQKAKIVNGKFEGHSVQRFWDGARIEADYRAGMIVSGTGKFFPRDGSPAVPWPPPSQPPFPLPGPGITFPGPEFQFGGPTWTGSVTSFSR